MALLKAVLSSKKAGAMTVGVLVVLLTEGLGMDEASASKVLNLLMAYIAGQGLADLGKGIGS